MCRAEMKSSDGETKDTMPLPDELLRVMAALSGVVMPLRPEGRAMRRREFFALVGGAAAWPVSARAQQLAMPVIGFLGPGTAQSDAYRVAAFQQGLREAGLVEGKDFTIGYGWA